jgi:GDP-L-fucose synthase
MQSHINVGFGSDITINELAIAVAKATGYIGNVSFDLSKPDGPPRKSVDSSRLNKLGWRPQVNLLTGLSNTYSAYLLSVRT